MTLLHTRDCCKTFLLQQSLFHIKFYPQKAVSFHARNRDKAQIWDTVLRKTDLLKPVRVDPWSGYRYYDAKQAIDFVKIKNLHVPDFTIEKTRGCSVDRSTDSQNEFALMRKIQPN